MPFSIRVECPHCKQTIKRHLEEKDFHDPFVVKCERQAAGCGRYFAVKVSASFKAESSKIFDGIDDAG
jgi:hypothetical protein